MILNSCQIRNGVLPIWDFTTNLVFHHLYLESCIFDTPLTFSDPRTIGNQDFIIIFSYFQVIIWEISGQQECATCQFLLFLYIYKQILCFEGHLKNSLKNFQKEEDTSIFLNLFSCSFILLNKTLFLISFEIKNGSFLFFYRLCM